MVLLDQSTKVELHLVRQGAQLHAFKCEQHCRPGKEEHDLEQKRRFQHRSGSVLGRFLRSEVGPTRQGLQPDHISITQKVQNRRCWAPIFLGRNRSFCQDFKQSSEPQTRRACQAMRMVGVTMDKWQNLDMYAPFVSDPVANHGSEHLSLTERPIVIIFIGFFWVSERSRTRTETGETFIACLKEKCSSKRSSLWRWGRRTVIAS